MVAPLIVVLTVALTILGGQGGAWPWLPAILPAILGGTAGLMVWMSTTMPVCQNDPTGAPAPSTPATTPAPPGWRPACWSVLVANGRTNQEIADELVLSGHTVRRPPRPSRPDQRSGRSSPRLRSAALSTLSTVGVLCIFPQGLVPIAFNLFGVDPGVKVWFAARYLSPSICRSDGSRLHHRRAGRDAMFWRLLPTRVRSRGWPPTRPRGMLCPQIFLQWTTPT